MIRNTGATTRRNAIGRGPSRLLSTQVLASHGPAHHSIASWTRARD